MIASQKVKKKGHDETCPQEILSNKIVRAQFIVPLQHNYNQKGTIYCKIICNTTRMMFYNITKYYDITY